jgi:hypothetical protein
MSVAGVEQRATALLGIHWQEVPDDGHLPVRRSLSQKPFRFLFRFLFRFV